MILVLYIYFFFFCYAQFHHRDPHLVGLLASEKIPEDSTIFYGLIADGIHTHPAALRIAHRVNPQGKILHDKIIITFESQN